MPSTPSVTDIDASSIHAFDFARALRTFRSRRSIDARSVASARRDSSSCFTSADAAGLPIFPGLVRYEEVADGVIDHAVRVTFESTRNAWINPASHCAGDTDSPAAPSMGMRFRLKSSYDTSGLTGQAAIIATALKQYGMINADNGSNWFISGTANKRWSNGNLNQLKEIPGSAFEVVQSEAPVEMC